MTDTQLKQERNRWRWPVALTALSMLTVGVAIGLPYYRWMQILDLRGSLLSLHHRLEPAIVSTLARRQSADWTLVQREAAAAFSADDITPPKRWAVWCIDQGSLIDPSSTPLALILVDRPRATGNLPTCASVIKSRIALAPLSKLDVPPEPVDADFLPDHERLLVLFVSGQVVQMTAGELGGGFSAPHH